MISPELLAFLGELAQNNNKEWFNPRKPQYKRLRQAFTAGLEDVAQEIAFFDQAVADTLSDPATVKIFRIYRDVRFSNDKSPLKTTMSGYVSAGGQWPAYYLQVQPGGSFAGGGIYRPSSKELKAIRETIDESYDELNAILDDPAFRTVYPQSLDRELQLKTAPRGVSLDHPAIELLRLTSFTATRPFSDEQLLADDFQDQLIAAFKALAPLNAYLRKAAKDR
ncbi:MAG: DUF2461 domain-containing protein [Candidatus Promineifilaceae bacterium]